MPVGVSNGAKRGGGMPAGNGDQSLTATRTVRRETAGTGREIGGDLCVLGAGIAGVATALEAAALGLRVVLVDGFPALGGQAVNSIVGTFCGLYSNRPDAYRFTYGLADRMLSDLDAEGALHWHETPVTPIVYYEEVALARWIERSVLEAGISVAVGAVLLDVRRDGRRIRSVDLATRHGTLSVSAAGFVDASGDAALAWEAGLECREPAAGPIFGSQQFVVEHLDETSLPPRDEMAARIAARAEEYGLVRHNGLAFYFPERGTAVINMTHVETPLDPVEASRKGIEGKDQADKVAAFLRSEFPGTFGDSRIRAYGFPGIRQTRWIRARHQITLDEVRAGTCYGDAIARTAWPIELHNRPEGLVWEPFGPDHVHYVPYSSLTPPGADNLIAVGRCIDGDPAALSSVRVMGPCIAMGAAAAHAFDLAGSGSVHQIDTAALQTRLSENLHRRDPLDRPMTRD